MNDVQIYGCKCRRQEIARATDRQIIQISRLIRLAAVAQRKAPFVRFLLVQPTAETPTAEAMGSLCLLVRLQHITYSSKMPPIRPQVLNDVFQQAADQARQKLPNLTQNQQVRSLVCGEDSDPVYPIEAQSHGACLYFFLVR
jgi:hypothetical protein